MATISSLGIGSGLDLSAIVTGLVDVERVPAEQRLDSQEETVTTELSAFGALKNSLSLFQGSLSSLKSSTSFSGKEATSSDDTVISTFATSFADSGSYAVEVTALAKQHSLASSAVTAFDTVDDTIGTGTLTVNFGSTTTGPYSFTPDTNIATQTITISEENNNTTLSGFRDYINDNDFGFSAAIVNDGNGFRLTLTSDDSGVNNSMEITVTDDGDGLDDDNVGLSQLAYNASAQSGMGQTVQAQDAALTVNGLAITRESNTVTGAIDGVTLNLLKADIGNTLTVNVATNTAAVKTSIENFVDSYNGLAETIDTLSSYDFDDNSVGILIGDFTIRSITNQLRSALSTSITQLSSNVQSLADIGIRTVAKGSLELDTAILDDALANFPDDVASLFSEQGRASDSGYSYLSSGNDTEQGTYSVNISTVATQAAYSGSTINSLVIDANNDEFSIQVDGVTSSTITLNQATYASATELASHLQAQINNDASLKAAGASVSVAYDNTNNKFDITSVSYGSESRIDVLSVDVNTANDIGLSVGSGLDGTDVAGTINGLAATGSGQLLTSTSGESDGLVVSVTSTTTGNLGNLSYTKGITQMLDDLVSSFTDDDGFIDSRETGFNHELDQIAEERVKLSLKIETLEARLIRQYSALDTLVSSFKSTSEFLTLALSSLVELNSINRN